MRLVVAITAVAAISLGAARAADLKYACSRGDTVRTVSVVTNSSSGYSCEVQYQKTSMGEAPQVLWHADNGTSFCADEARALIDRLGEAGWSCVASDQAQAQAASALPQPLAVPVPVGAPQVAEDGGASQQPASAPSSGVTGALDPAAAESTPAGDRRAPQGALEGLNLRLRPTIH